MAGKIESGKHLPKKQKPKPAPAPAAPKKRGGRQAPKGYLLRVDAEKLLGVTHGQFDALIYAGLPSVQFIRSHKQKQPTKFYEPKVLERFYADFLAGKILLPDSPSDSNS